MAKIANDNCNKIYITDDNPRNESPEKLETILQNLSIKIKLLTLVIDL